MAVFVARDASRVHLSEMHDAKLTQQDINKALGLWPVKVHIGQSQLLYLGHVARLPEDRPERLALFGWFQVEAAFHMGKTAPKLVANYGNVWLNL